MGRWVYGQRTRVDKVVHPRRRLAQRVEAPRPADRAADEQARLEAAEEAQEELRGADGRGESEGMFFQFVLRWGEELVGRARHGGENGRVGHRAVCIWRGWCGTDASWGPERGKSPSLSGSVVRFRFSARFQESWATRVRSRPEHGKTPESIQGAFSAMMGANPMRSGGRIEVETPPAEVVGSTPKFTAAEPLASPSHRKQPVGPALTAEGPESAPHIRRFPGFSSGNERAVLFFGRDKLD